MQRLFLLCLMTGVGLMTASAIVAAQEGTYDENALRVYESRGTIRIVRGISENVVASIGAFRRGELTNLVRPSSNAVTEAEIFERNYRPGLWIAALGIGVMGAAIGVSRTGVDQPVPVGLTITSFALIGYGAVRLETAYRALSKAVWWYNRDLKH